MKTATDIRNIMKTIENNRAKSAEKKAIAFCEEKAIKQIENHARFLNDGKCQIDVPFSISINDVVYYLRAHGFRCNRVRSTSPDVNTCEVIW